MPRVTITRDGKKISAWRKDKWGSDACSQAEFFNARKIQAAQQAGKCKSVLKIYKVDVAKKYIDYELLDVESWRKDLIAGDGKADSNFTLDAYELCKLRLREDAAAGECFALPVCSRRANAAGCR